MSIFVKLGLLVCFQAPGSRAVTPVFVQKGKDVLLNVKTDDDLQKDVWWISNTDIVIIKSLLQSEPKISSDYTGRVEFSVKNYSLKLKNLQEADSGVYTVRMIGERDLLVKYNVSVQDPVSPVDLTVDSVSSSSDSCNLTVACRTQDSVISSTFRCDTKSCSEEGGERSEVMTSGASLHVYLVNDSIICNHRNQVSWTEDIEMIEHYCLQNTGSECVPAGISMCLVKTVVLSVGLVVMVSAVISVHIVVKLKKQK
ncbi:uncharacterized protein [Chaetodon trifascialis]|uniref:uncharacterized protein n=1 Tax=Chaetodon trifascialis TaxID=109706 RepID=UPI0039936FB9